MAFGDKLYHSPRTAIRFLHKYEYLFPSAKRRLPPNPAAVFLEKTRHK